jgi:hypothetical protein
MHTTTNISVCPPVVGENVWGFDADDFNGTSWFAVPDSWKESVLEFRASGEAFCFALGDKTLTGVTSANKSTVTSNAVETQGSVCYRLDSGQTIRVDLRRVVASKKARIAILGVTGTAGNILRVTRLDGYVS